MDNTGALLISADGKPLARLKCELEYLVTEGELIHELVFGKPEVQGDPDIPKRVSNLIGMLQVKKVI